MAELEVYLDPKLPKLDPFGKFFGKKRREGKGFVFYAFHLIDKKTNKNELISE